MPLRDKAGGRKAMTSPDIHSVGKRLQSARLETGATIADVAAEIMVPQHYLVAIEEDRHTDLPGQTYAIGFVKNYSKFLGLPVDDVVAQLKSEVNFPKTLDTLELASGFVDPPKQNLLPSGASIAAGLCVAVGVYGLWFAASAKQSSAALPAALPDVVLAPSIDEKKKIKEEIAAIAPALDEPSDVRRESVPIEPENITSRDEVEERAAAQPDIKPKQNDQTQPVVAAAEPPFEDQEVDYVIEPGNAGPLDRVLIHIAAESWVEVRSGGQIFYTGVKQAGDVIEVPADRVADASLTTGNAGGIWLSVGDWRSQALGETGRVRRNLVLAPAQLQSTLLSADRS